MRQISTQVKLQLIKRFDACRSNRARKKLCKEEGVGVRTIYDWKKRQKLGLPLDRWSGSGRPRMLTKRQIKSLVSTLKKDPSITNEEVVARHSLPVDRHTIGVYLARMDYSAKKIVDEEPKVDVEASLDYLKKVKRIPWHKRVYMDESFLYANEAPKYGRSPRGQRIYRLRRRRTVRETMFLAIRVTGLCHPPTLTPNTAKDAIVLDYVRQHLAPSLQSGDVVIWDRLGRSGRSKSPKAQHYNPEAQELIRRRGAEVLFLPPLGKLFNPAELAISFIKEYVRHSPAAQRAARMGTEMTHVQLLRSMKNGALTITADHCRKWFEERANGRAFKRLYPELSPRKS